MDITKTALKTMGFIAVTMLGLPIGLAFVVWLADGAERVSFPDSAVFSVRYIVSVLLLMLLLIPFFWQAARRKPGTPISWGEAMLGASYVFFLLFWLYGVVPHEYLNWADSELAWRPDRKIIGPEGTWASWWGFWADIPLTIHLQILRDVVATLLYVVGLGGLIWGFAWWNDREKRAAAAAAIEPTSAYGRPLVTKAQG